MSIFMIDSTFLIIKRLYKSINFDTIIKPNMLILNTYNYANFMVTKYDYTIGNMF